MSDGGWHPLGSAEAFSGAGLHGALVAGHKLCVGRAGSDWFAVDDTCPHAGGSLSMGMLDGDEVVCPIHAWGFDIASGACAEDPSCSIRAYPVREEDGHLQVRL